MDGGFSEEASLSLGNIFPYVGFLFLMGRSLGVSMN